MTKRQVDGRARQEECEVYHTKPTDGGSGERVLLVVKDWRVLMLLTNALKNAGQAFVKDGLGILSGELMSPGGESEFDRVDGASMLIGDGQTLLEIAQTLLPLVEGGAWSATKQD